MLSIKAFQDGDRFVVVFEGLSDHPSQEEMIKGFLGGLLTSVEQAPDAAAIPIQQEDVPEVTVPEEEIAQEPDRDDVFPDGPYKGHTPGEVLELDKTAGFIYLSEAIKGRSPEDPLFSIINKEISGVLKNFATCEDEESYSKRLSSNQVAQFIKKFRLVMSPELQEELDMAGGNEPELRKIIAKAVRYFKAP